MQQPLAYRMRPRNLDEVVGQQHLVGPGKIIRRMVEAKMLSSMILYGPPGTGKTSIASAIAGSTRYAFRMLNAATDTKKDLQIVAEEAKMSGTVILLLDEVHRLDKTKQDFLLPHLESGKIIMIGATWLGNRIDPVDRRSSSPSFTSDQWGSPQCTQWIRTRCSLHAAKF